nr:hypothetical protein [Spirochaetota bacterium]
GNFLNSLGDYRLMKLSPRLDKLNILKIIPTSGDHQISIKIGFHKYKEIDIKNMISDIRESI